MQINSFPHFKASCTCWHRRCRRTLACILSKNASLKATMTAGQETVYLETTDLASSKNSASKQISCISG